MLVYQTKEWKKKRAKILKKRNKCEVCGSTDVLTIHHPKGWSYAKTYGDINKIDIIVLCRKCHYKIEKCDFDICPVCCKRLVYKDYFICFQCNKNLKS